MKILITGAAGFVGQNLTAALENLLTGRDRTRPGLHIDEIFTFDTDTDPSMLDGYCREADFVFHLAGVNRTQNPADFQTGNIGLTARLLEALERHGNACPVMLSSSVQASCIGRYDSDYGRSKRAGEELVFAHGERTGARVLVYRFPNLFGKWCRPNYNSAVATFCHNTANGLPITVTDPAIELELLYIDDLVAEMLDALEGREHHCTCDGIRAVPDKDGMFCAAPVTHRVTLGEIVRLLETFRDQPDTRQMPPIPQGSFAKKLYSTYLSYLPKDRIAFPLMGNTDARGSFTELLRTSDSGQFSVNVSAPGVTKGQHWHNSKWELFIVVSGRGRIRMRRVGGDEVLEFDVSGERIEAVHMLPGYTHSIVNLSDTEPLVTLMWANECFDAAHPDTYALEV